MIFFSFKQVHIALFYFFIGLICGLILQLFEIVLFKKMQKIPIKIIFDTILYGFLCIFYVFLNNFLNFGIFSFIPIIMFLFGILTIKYQTGKIVEFFETVWYLHTLRFFCFICHLYIIIRSFFNRNNLFNIQ